MAGDKVSIGDAFEITFPTADGTEASYSCRTNELRSFWGRVGNIVRNHDEDEGDFELAVPTVGDEPDPVVEVDGAGARRLFGELGAYLERITPDNKGPLEPGSTDVD